MKTSFVIAGLFISSAVNWAILWSAGDFTGAWVGLPMLAQTVALGAAGFFIADGLEKRDDLNRVNVKIAVDNLKTDGVGSSLEQWKAGRE